MSKAHLIDWVDAACREWGHQIRTRYYADDGFPTRSVLAKFREGGQTAYNGATQHTPEFLTRDAIAVSAAYKHIGEDLQSVVFAHYVVRGVPAKAKAGALNIAPRTYYWRLHNANGKLARYMSGEVVQKVCNPVALHIDLAKNAA